MGMNVRPGDTVRLDASESFDPDGDDLSFKWWHMPESGTWDGGVDVCNHDTRVAEVKVPEDAAGKTIHIICEVTDSGYPALTSYRRVILNVKP